MGHVLFGDMRLLKEREDVVLDLDGLALVLRRGVATLAHVDPCDLCREIARSDVRARKSCSNVPSGFLPATENKIINQEIPDRRERWFAAERREHLSLSGKRNDGDCT